MGPLKESKAYNKWLHKWQQPRNEETYKSFKFDFCTRLLFLGFKDYTAARDLLLKDNSDYHLTGLVLASSSVEKYIKAYLCASDYYVGNIHMNQLQDFKDALNKIGSNGKYLLRELDNKFIELLSDTYKFRYFSETEHADGVLINQALGELDFTVHLIESCVKPPESADATKYQKAVNNSDHPIHQNNYVLQKTNKAEFMERDSTWYAVKAITHGMIVEIIPKEAKSDISYKGQIETVKMDY